MRVALPFKAKAHSELLLQPLRVMLWILKITMEALHFRQSEMWLRKWTCNLFICDSSTLPSTMVWELEWFKVDKNPALSRVFKFQHPRILKERLKQSGIVTFKGERPYNIEHTSSRPITEVKQCWVKSVLEWVTAWEHWMHWIWLWAAAAFSNSTTLNSNERS